MISKVLGIVIHEQLYQETSKILTVITKEYGIISLLAKGCRKYTNKLSSGSKTLTIGYFYFIYKKDKMMVLREVDVVLDLPNIKSDIVNISYVTYITKLTNLTAKIHYHRDIFDIYYNYLLQIENKLDPRLLTLIVEIKYLKFLGIKPITSQCVVCNNTNNIVTISIDDYGYMCTDCIKNEFIFDKKTLKLIDMFLSIDISTITKINISDNIILELEKFISIYYYKHSGLHIEKSKFIEILKKI